jgi:tetratricopeptide (TPR) repeat protein
MLEGFINFIAGIGAFNAVIGIVSAVVVIAVGLIISAGGVAKATSNMIDLAERFGWSAGRKSTTAPVDNNDPGSPTVSSDNGVDWRTELIRAINEGNSSVEDATKLAEILAQERRVALPGEAGQQSLAGDGADETYVEEFIRLATSKNDRERRAAALDAEGKTEAALALLETLAEEESTQAAERWKARGAMAYNAFTAKAIDSYERAVACHPKDADAHNQLGSLYFRVGDLAAAASACSSVMALGNQSADSRLLAVANGNLGLIEQARGNLDAAEDYHKRSLALDERLGRKEGMANAYGNLGMIEEVRGNLDGAEEYHKRALALNEELGRKDGMANAYGNLGNIERTRGNLDAAEEHLKRALALHEELGRKDGMANSHGNLGLIEQRRGNLEAAEKYHKRSLALDESLGSKEGMASDYGSLGLIEVTRGNFDAALKNWNLALKLFDEIGMPHMVDEVRGWIEEAEKGRDER